MQKVTFLVSSNDQKSQLNFNDKTDKFPEQFQKDMNCKFRTFEFDPLNYR